MKLSKPFKIFLIIVACIIVFGFTFQRTTYVGEISCKGRTDISIFGIKIVSQEVAIDAAEYLSFWVGETEERQYTISGRSSLLFGGWVRGTPKGNWFWVKHLKTLEDKGMPHETAIEIAKGLVSDDESIRESAIERIRLESSADRE